MFGKNDNKTTDAGPVMPAPLDSPEPTASAPSQEITPTLPFANPAPAPDPSPTSDPVAADNAFLDNTPLPTPAMPQSEPQAAPDVPSPSGSSPDELLQIKQDALHSLAPLVDKLDQTPEEKFKTTMMMLQASDNPQLVKEAYAAANAITDEKARAQALLDVVNEINYFTHAGGAA